MNRTGMNDMNGIEIKIGDEVLYKGNRYDVVVNDFNSRVCIDGDAGHGLLIEVHKACEIITTGE